MKSGCGVLRLKIEKSLKAHRHPKFSIVENCWTNTVPNAFYGWHIMKVSSQRTMKLYRIIALFSMHSFWGLYSAVLGITLLAVDIAPMKHEDFLLPICEVILRLLIAWPHKTWVWKKHNYNGVKLFLCVWLTSHCHCIELELFGNDHLHRHCQVLLIKAKPMFMWVREPSVNICELWSLYS